MASEEWKKVIQAKSAHHVQWDYSIEVPVITLDDLIAAHGLPAFTKIDVEDFEVEVLEGLSQALPALSFEYFAYLPKRAMACINLLEKLGTYRYNLSYGESQQWVRQEWLTADQMRDEINAFDDKSPSGDIYASLN